MADGDDDDDDDDDEGGDGDEGNDGDGDDGDQQHGADAGNQDHAMTDSVLAVDPPPVAEIPAADSADTSAPKGAAPPNPLTLAPPAGSLAVGSPRLEGSPLKNVLSSTEATSSEIPPPPLPAQTVKEETAAESTIAQPPSQIVGAEPAEAIQRDLSGPESPRDAAAAETASSEPAPLKEESPWQEREEAEPVKEEALLPPPPEQVGNIDSPRAESGLTKSHDGEDRGGEEGEAQSERGALPPQGLLNQGDSVLTEDTIKPDDSASIQFPPSESAPMSELGAASAEEAKEPAAPLERVSSPSTPKPASPSQLPNAEDEKPDLLGGLMGELDREAAPEGSRVEAPWLQPQAGEPAVGPEASDGEPLAEKVAREKSP